MFPNNLDSKFLNRTNNLDRKQVSLVTKTDNLVTKVKLVSLGFVEVDTGVYFSQLGEKTGTFTYNLRDAHR